MPIHPATHRRHFATRAAVSALAVIAGHAHAQNGEWTFEVVSAQSGINATLDNSIDTTGTLIGNWNADTNPTGTRTKPGINIFQPFGATENLPVDTTLGAALAGQVQSRTAGGFNLEIAGVPGGGGGGSGVVTLSGLNLDLLSDGAASLPVTINLGTATGFRTRSPSFLYPPGVLDVPIGSASLTALNLAQLGPAVGTLTPTGANTYDFTIIAAANITLGFSVLGTDIALPGAIPIPLVFSGSLAFDGTNATLLSTQPIDFMQSLNPDLVVPQFEVPLPTLNPATPANLLFDLTLSEIMLGLNGTLTTRAAGTLVPSPGALVLVGLAAMAGTRRSRRSIKAGLAAR